MHSFSALFLVFVSFCSFSSAAKASVCERFGANTEQFALAYNSAFSLNACSFNQAVIDVATFYAVAVEKRQALVINRYLNNENLWPKDCLSSGGGVFSTYNRNGKAVHFCQFIDNSMMEYETFNRGLRAKENRQMNRALGIKH